MKIATFNVNGINGRLARVRDWLQAEPPDMACLQELKTPGSKFPAGALRQAGCSPLWHGQASYHGVAILARGSEPIDVRKCGAACPATLRTGIAATSRRPCAACWWAACTCPTATRSRARSSTTSWRGSSG